MQLITILSAATAMIAGVSATDERNAVTLTESCNEAEPWAKIINRCDYPVYIWSVFKGNGCPTDGMVTLKTGETYQENLADPKGGVTGVSIKISKEQQCKPNDIVQFEYFMERTKGDEYDFNYLDVSYVDCLGDDCPTKSEGYYLVAGNQTGADTASATNQWCPILSCTDAASCAKMSYILPDDVQTKTCNLDQNVHFYMCGGHAPDGDSDEPAQSSSSSKQAASSTSKAASSTYQAASSTYQAASSTPIAAYSAPAAYSHKTKTEVVYVTAYETVKAKRHAHDHAGRHQHFHA
ncbi:hypothetical protein P153DRAFT_300570 [Dothidotthia symphoricarpi CBS 119687]|uniref:Lytic polysaccharide monooxygenase n=1 Tax=Dothidotthia symphoricarpi CBS 119687 TaxID=1392245 RepID=A0A6A6A2M9_9PLEO|nr:uncharacterized protein P153DRAFT_300570 [Dothidotthia symphoricarpi CBS 119687]KAF2125157.1 hypothetical protein P153DRAFT_300570 [Dothidotthia symphoricarpi CBS 119687]